MTRRTPTALILVALLIAALAGVPGLFRSNEPNGTPGGVVVDGRGYGVPDAAVFLFSEEHLQLVEETRTDSQGDFAFQSSPPRARVLVRPKSSSGLLTAWGPSSEEAGDRHDFVLRPARPISVLVRDAQGDPLAAAEVRAYEHRSEAAVVSLGETDARGEVTLLVPAETDLAVFAPETRFSCWRFRAKVAEGGASFSFQLPPVHTLGGRVQDEDGPLAGIVVVAWDEGLEDAWNGFAVSDTQGRFVLALGGGRTLVRALDPGLMHLPARERVSAARTTPLEFTLARGTPLVVRTTRRGLPLVSRVWSWSPEAEAWSWGGLTNGMGRITLPVSARYAIHAEPLDPSHAPLEVWDVPFEAGTLHLEAQPDG